MQMSERSGSSSSNARYNNSASLPEVEETIEEGLESKNDIRRKDH